MSSGKDPVVPSGRAANNLEPSKQSGSESTHCFTIIKKCLKRATLGLLTISLSERSELSEVIGSHWKSREVLGSFTFLIES